MNNVTHRKAQIGDFSQIIKLLADDKLGCTREQAGSEVAQEYLDAFAKIDSDSNQYLMVLENDGEVIGTCPLTLMPSLTFLGSTCLQIEAVRVNSSIRGQNLGQQMIEVVINWGFDHGATILQLTTNKERTDALRFYEKLGFKASHEGVKLYLEQK
ncbi:GNAT family N-acetyltransferase [Facilibium subflavum]|uniref:GNAT family N-acetyltransferase n=1 Tax=Facilibium subflavum TaxID=2219058 RepID=UPI000E64B849|nr:GNAT family N-acetyltransferase [Facilibium subflavum]